MQSDEDSLKKELEEIELKKKKLEEKLKKKRELDAKKKVTYRTVVLRRRVINCT